MTNTLKTSSLVLYKDRPAQIKRLGDKLEIEAQNGKSFKVRPKDVTLLHPGPLKSWGDLQTPSGDVETAWELLAGESTTLAELADLIYDDYTPATAWAVWQLLAEGLYFKGTPSAIQVRTPEEVQKILTTRESKAAEKESWSQFVKRVKQGQILPEDKRYIAEVESLALGRQEKSRLLRELNQTESPEVAHALLLRIAHWHERINPYPARFGLPSASAAGELPQLSEEPRVDLTHLTALAIDDAGSKDPDDALSLDGQRLWVHVADVAALIAPDSPADIEARVRGANLYLPEGTIQMLPPQTTQILALGLSDISPALSFGLDLNAEGEVSQLEIVPSWIKVQRLSYEQAEEQLHTEPLGSLYRLALSHQQRRRANGAIEIDLPEVKIRVVEDEVIIKPLPPLKSRDLVREAMLMTGEAAARFALEHNIPFPFSSQESPEENEEFSATMSGMFARRRTLKRGQVKSIPSLHAGLGLDVYTQVTSPLRRYADLLAHQQLRAFLNGDELLPASNVLEHIGTADAVNGGVRQAERLANKHWTLVYLLQHPDWQGEGILIEKRHKRGIILIPELDLETRLSLRQDLPLDSSIQLKVNKVNLPELDVHVGRIS